MELNLPYLNNLVFFYRFYVKSTVNGDPMVNGHLARKLVEEVRNIAQDKLPRLHQMGEKIVKEILRRQ